jgi:hypothetical protein
MPYNPPPAHAAALALVGIGRASLPSMAGLTLDAMVRRGFGAEDLIARYPGHTALMLWEALRTLPPSRGTAHAAHRRALMRLLARRHRAAARRRPRP